MKSFVFIVVFFAQFITSLAQTNSTLTNTKNIPIIYTSIEELYSYNFISSEDAENIVGNKCKLIDSTSRNTGGVLRYSFTYIVPFKDSTSKGRLFFSYEQYKDKSMCQSIFQSLKQENGKSGSINDLIGFGDEAYMIKDSMNFPFVIILKNNKLFKFKLYYLNSTTPLEELLKTAKKLVEKY